MTAPDGRVAGDADPTTDLIEALSQLARVLRTFPLDEADVVNPAQMIVLGRLFHRGGARLTELADALGCDLSVASRHVNLLVERGLADRTRDPGDGRASQFWLTPAGAALLDRNRAKRVTWLEAVLHDFDQAQRRSAAEVLARIGEALRAARGKKPPVPSGTTPTLTPTTTTR